MGEIPRANFEARIEKALPAALSLFAHHWTKYRLSHARCDGPGRGGQTLSRSQHRVSIGPAKIHSNKRYGRTVQPSDRKEASKPSLPFRRGAAGHPATLCLALQPATPAIILGQKAAIASHEEFVQPPGSAQDEMCRLPGR